MRNYVYDNIVTPFMALVTVLLVSRFGRYVRCTVKNQNAIGITKTVSHQYSLFRFVFPENSKKKKNRYFRGSS